MLNKNVEMPAIAEPIQPSPGFEKKQLSEYKLDICGLCGFGCRYCSSNAGNYLRINRSPFADLTEQQTGERTLPADDPELMFTWPDVLDNLCEQLRKKPKNWGEGKTLVFSMLTDGFSPQLIKDGTTEAALRMVLENTSFRIRVLTKNAIVGTSHWSRLFAEYRDRFVVGLSTGTLNDAWAKRVEVGTPRPSARLNALRKLQDAGIATFGMLCPIFPDVIEKGQLEQLVDQVRPELVEHVWAEPYNDRQNWRVVRDGYKPGSFGYRWMTDVYEHSQKDLWSEYATELYVRLRDKARSEGWTHKLRYLLYEGDISETDSHEFQCLEGVLLQSKPGEDGFSRNKHIAALQS